MSGKPSELECGTMSEDELLCELHNDGENIFVLIDGVKIAKRGRAWHGASRHVICSNRDGWSATLKAGRQSRSATSPLGCTKPLLGNGGVEAHDSRAPSQTSTILLPSRSCLAASMAGASSRCSTIRGERAMCSPTFVSTKMRKCAIRAPICCKSRR